MIIYEEEDKMGEIREHQRLVVQRHCTTLFHVIFNCLNPTLLLWRLFLLSERPQSATINSPQLSILLPHTGTIILLVGQYPCM